MKTTLSALVLLRDSWAFSKTITLPPVCGLNVWQLQIAMDDASHAPRTRFDQPPYGSEAKDTTKALAPCLSRAVLERARFWWGSLGALSKNAIIRANPELALIISLHLGSSAVRALKTPRQSLRACCWCRFRIPLRVSGQRRWFLRLLAKTVSASNCSSSVQIHSNEKSSMPGS